MDKSVIEIACFGKNWTDNIWGKKPLVNRLCFVQGGSGFYIKNGERHILKNGCAYLFPAGVSVKFENNPADAAECTWFDFFINPGFNLDKELEVSFVQNTMLDSVSEVLLQFAKKIGNIYKAGDAEKNIIKNYFTSVICSLNEICSFKFVCDERIIRAVEAIHKNYFKEIDVRGLAESVFMETNHFIKIFKKHMKFSPYQYIKDYRFSVAFGMLKKGMKVTDVARHTGFMSVSAFSNAYKKKFGVYPGTVYGAEKSEIN